MLEEAMRRLGHKSGEPERVLATTYEYNTDIWSLGLSILEAAEGRFPYSEAKDEDDLLDMISENDPPTAPKGASNEFAEFINQCLKRHPKKRVQANDLIDEDSFVRRGMENPVDLAAFLAGVRERNPDYNKKFPLFN
uniref:mitogen-activated protein kinase kinase n=1 Tax=Palpitomonas bilix TaxID=652834 RepID=A0A7S3G433_9EUKA|mmetsp:Transcript_24624/g.62341  ORF Transcript_24624/g.62341 Transcript_24624/m.62341 type:complete len:137 (+) Transcript_24624:122-532(+)